MKVIKSTVIYLCLFTSVACSNRSDYPELIIGTWTNEIEFGRTSYIYNSDGTYLYEYDDGSSETGTWRIKNDILFHTPSNKEEIEDRISTLNKDRMEIIMMERFRVIYVRIDTLQHK